MKSFDEGIKPAVTCAKNSSNPETEKTSQTRCLPSLHDHLKHFKSSVGLKKYTIKYYQIVLLGESPISLSSYLPLLHLAQEGLRS